MRTKGQSFLSGAITLMVSAAFVKIIGALFKIPLAAVLGGEGMGYYMTAYSIFNPMFALSAAGFSVSVSKLCSAAEAQHRYKDRTRIFHTAVILFPAIGMILCAVIYTAAPYFVKAVDNQAALKAVRMMAPSLLFCCITSVLRGFCEGERNMFPTAISQVTESVVKLLLGLYFACRCIASASAEFERFGTVFGKAVIDRQAAISEAAPYAAAAAIAGVAVSTAAGCIVMIICCLKSEKTHAARQTDSISAVMAASALIKTAVPVCAGALVINLASLVDLFSVMNRINNAVMSDWQSVCKSLPELQLSGVKPMNAANYLYGSYTGLAMTVFNMSPALTASMGICAIPMISALAATGKRVLLRQRIESVVRITIIAAVPLGMGMSAMAEPILTALFGKNPYEVAVAAKLLKIMGIASIFVSLSGALNSMLQAVGRVYAPVKILFVGSLIKLAVNWILISKAEITILGAPWGTLLCYLFITVASASVLMRTVDGDIGLFPMMIKPVIAGLACCAVSLFTLKKAAEILGFRIATGVSVMLGGMVYIVFLVILGGFCDSDLKLLDNNSKLKKLLVFCRIIPCKSHYNAVE